LEHVLKVIARVIEAIVKKIVKIDDMQFGFLPGRGTTDAIFIVRRLHEKFLAKKKTAGWPSSTLKMRLTGCHGR